MNNNGCILKRWLLCLLMLCIQLVSHVAPANAACYRIAQLNINKQVQQFDHLSDILEHIPTSIDADDGDMPESFRTLKSRRKSRYYLSVASQQFSAATRISTLDTVNPALKIFIKENKTGEYLQQDAFLPAYYTFLFRFTLF